MAIPIIFGAIDVNTLDTNATISVGEVSQSNWNSHAKNNFGNGMLFGINWTAGSLNYILDNDFIDSPITDPDLGVAPRDNSLDISCFKRKCYSK